MLFVVMSPSRAELFSARLVTFFLSARKLFFNSKIVQIGIFHHSFFSFFFPLHFHRTWYFFHSTVLFFSVAKTFSPLKMNGLLGKAKKIKVLSKKTIHQHNIDSSVSARKLKCPSSARLETFLARKISARTDH